MRRQERKAPSAKSTHARSGADFAGLARANIRKTAAASSGGDLLVRRRRAMVALSFEEAVHKLKPGQVSSTPWPHALAGTSSSRTTSVRLARPKSANKTPYANIRRRTRNQPLRELHEGAH